MANLQIKGIDDRLYAQLRKLSAAQNRSISQEVIFLIKRYLGQNRKISTIPSPAEKLIELSGSWLGNEEPEEILKRIKGGRKNSTKLSEGF